MKCFDKESIRKANKIAARRNYNRVLDDKFVRSLPEDKLFPAFMTFIHEHAQGNKVDPHIRCWVAFDAEGTKAFIDCDMKLYKSLKEIEVSDHEEEK
jgi:hypothetical protein